MALPIEGNYIKTKVQTLPSSEVSNFTGVIDISQIPDINKTFLFSDVDTTDGTRGRVSLSLFADEIASDWIDFDSVNKTGLIAFDLGTVPVTGDVFVYIYSPNTRNDAYAATDIYGKNNAYHSDYERYAPDGGITDRTVNANLGTEYGGAVSGDTDGIIGSGTTFNGVDQAVGFADIFDSSGSGSIEVSFFVSSLPTSSSMIYIGGAFSNKLYIQALTDGTVEASLGGSFTESSSNTFDVESWNTVIVSWEAGVVDIYLNGVNTTFASTVTPGNSQAEGVGAYFGSLTNPSSNWFTGVISNVKIISTYKASSWKDLEYAQISTNNTFWGNWENSVELNVVDDTIYMLAMGQSNMLGRDTTGTKFTNNNVLIGNTTTGNFEVWDQTSDPAQNAIPDPGVGSSGPILNADCPAFYFADHIANTYNVTVKVLMAAWGGTAIQYFQDQAVLWDEVQSQLTQFANDVPRIDVVTWFQGESDSGSATYATDYATVITTYRMEEKIPDNVPWIASELLSTFTTVNAALNTVSDTDSNVWTTSNADFVDKGDGLHLDSASSILVGDTRWAAAFVEAIPTINANASQTYQITGVTYDKDGNILPSVQVSLFKHSGSGVYSYIDTTVSDATTGAYVFSGIVDNDPSYMVYAHLDDTTNTFDCSDNNLTPVEE